MGQIMISRREEIVEETEAKYWSKEAVRHWMAANEFGAHKGMNENDINMFTCAAQFNSPI